MLFFSHSNRRPLLLFSLWTVQNVDYQFQCTNKIHLLYEVCHRSRHVNDKLTTVTWNPAISTFYEWKKETKKHRSIESLLHLTTPRSQVVSSMVIVVDEFCRPTHFNNWEIVNRQWRSVGNTQGKNQKSIIKNGTSKRIAEKLLRCEPLSFLNSFSRASIFLSTLLTVNQV